MGRCQLSLRADVAAIRALTCWCLRAPPARHCGRGRYSTAVHNRRRLLIIRWQMEIYAVTIYVSFSIEEICHLGMAVFRDTLQARLLKHVIYNPPILQCNGLSMSTGSRRQANTPANVPPGSEIPIDPLLLGWNLRHKSSLEDSVFHGGFVDVLQLGPALALVCFLRSFCF